MPDVEAGIRRRIEDGGFKDENEVMREALHLLDLREYQREQFRISVQEDFAAVKRGEGVELTSELWEELIREADDDSREASSLIQMSVLEAEEEKLSAYRSKYAMTHEQDKMNRHLHHIIETVSRIESYVGDRSCDQFLADPRTRDAVFYNIVVVGEASRRVLLIECEGLSAEARQALAEAAAIGDRLPRQYANIDVSAIWDAIQVKLPGLKRQLMQWLSARDQVAETQ